MSSITQHNLGGYSSVPGNKDNISVLLQVQCLETREKKRECYYTDFFSLGNTLAC